MALKDRGGVFGRNPKFKSVEVEGSLTVAGESLPDLTSVLVSSDIGSTVQGYDADTAKYDDATANFTGTLQNGGSNVLVDTDIGSTVQGYDATILTSSDIGSTVQGYDADTAKYDDVTANFTGTLQNGGSNVLVDTDIGSSVQGYDADTVKYDDATPQFDNYIYSNGDTAYHDGDKRFFNAINALIMSSVTSTGSCNSSGPSLTFASINISGDNRQVLTESSSGTPSGYVELISDSGYFPTVIVDCGNALKIRHRTSIPSFETRIYIRDDAFFDKY